MPPMNSPPTSAAERLREAASFNSIESQPERKVAIRINVVQSRCNRSVEQSRYAESLSDEREQ